MNSIPATDVHPGTVVNSYERGYRTVVSIKKLPDGLIRLNFAFGPQEYYTETESVDVRPLAS